MARAYPGDDADPKALAEYCADVARDYALPPVLPVMGSYPELTPAWTTPGNLASIPGYLWPVDHCSVGLWQQQADDLGCGVFGWGNRDQLIQVPFALRRFCEEAAKLIDDEDFREDQTDAVILGRWCQIVQRSAYAERYTLQGYPAATALLSDAAPVEDEWPQLRVGTTSQGWAYDLATGKFLRGDPGEKMLADDQGWFFDPVQITPEEPEDPAKPWAWPEAWDEPYAGDYVARHPTRYTWRSDIEVVARHLVDNFDVWCNTYYDHPEGYWRTRTSLDVWASGGRGDWLDKREGDKVEKLVWRADFGPPMAWYIRHGFIYGPWNDWNGSPFGDGSVFTNHDDHIHITYEGVD